MELLKGCSENGGKGFLPVAVDIFIRIIWMLLVVRLGEIEDRNMFL
jgi:hypothetical protein